MSTSFTHFPPIKNTVPAFGKAMRYQACSFGDFRPITVGTYLLEVCFRPVLIRTRPDDKLISTSAKYPPYFQSLTLSRLWLPSLISILPGLSCVSYS